MFPVSGFAEEHEEHVLLRKSVNSFCRSTVLPFPRFTGNTVSALHLQLDWWTRVHFGVLRV